MPNSPAWNVLFHRDFEPEFAALDEPVQTELLGKLLLIREFGPQLGRPHVDTLDGSAHSNMKELRFQLDGVWRFAFAFDPQRQAIFLTGGNKEGKKPRRFYNDLIRIADERFANYIASVARTGSKKE